jgi:hypothetical protein
MTIRLITLNTQNAASSLDDFYDCIIEEQRYHDFNVEYVAPLLREMYDCDVETSYVHGYCQAIEVDADSDNDEISIKESVYEASLYFWDWVADSGPLESVIAIDWENETDGNYAADQIQKLIRCGVDEKKAIEVVTEHLLEDYEDHPQSGHTITMDRC